MTWLKHNWKPLLAILVVGVLFTSNWFERQRRIKAELTNIELKERARLLELEREAMRKKFLLLGEASTVKIGEWMAKYRSAETKAAGIQVKSAAEIRAIRTQAGELQTRYDVLEIEALRLTDKVAALNLVIEPLRLANAELETRDLTRLAQIEHLQGQLGECQKLLNVSIDNTDSLLKKSWVLKLFDKVCVVAGVSIGIDGVVRPAVAVGFKVL